MSENIGVIPDNLPMAHSEFSPSGSSRWMACPASIKMVRELNLKRTSNVYADYGSCAHELGAILLIDPFAKAEDYLGKTLYGDQKVDHEMVKGVNEYVDYVMSYMTETAKLSVESRVSLEHLYPGTFGTTDAAIVDVANRIIHGFDLKFGKGVAVEVEENTQLQLYMIAILIDLAKQGIDLKQIDKVVLHIVQPRCPHPNGPRRSWETTVEDLKNVSRLAREAIVNACSDDPTFNPGEKQCQWCEAAKICRPLAEYSMKVACNEFSQFAVADEMDFKNTNFLTLDEIEKLVSYSGIIRHLLKVAEGQILNSLRSGVKSNTYKLVSGRSIRRWDSYTEDELVDKLLSEELDLPIDENDLYKKKLISPTQLEKLIPKGLFKEKVEPLVVKPEGKVTFALKTDKRRELAPDLSAEDEFAGFAELELDDEESEDSDAEE